MTYPVLGENIVSAGLQRVTYSCLEQGNWRMMGFLHWIWECLMTCADLVRYGIRLALDQRLGIAAEKPILNL